MEWQIKPMAHRSAASGVPLEVGEAVVCFLYVDPDGEIARADVRAAEEEAFPRPETVIGQWHRVVKDRGEEIREAREQRLATAEELFLGLFEIDEAADPPEGTVGRDREVLKQLLALLLERKRVLRSQGRVEAGLQQYLHPRSKQVFQVPMDPIEPAEMQRLQNSLDHLVW